MARLYSNELRAVMYPNNFLDNAAGVLKEHCLTVQHFDYQCEHKRNQSGEVYGATDPVLLKFTIRVNSPYHARVFYQRLVLSGHYEYSLLFNVTFDANQRLSNYEDGMVVNGYVVSVEERYTSQTDTDGSDKQMLLDVVLLVRSTTYLGREEQNNYTNVFIQ